MNTKYFCIGRNKTGTTSLKKAFSDLGFKIGNQRVAEMLILEYARANFELIIKYCKTAQVFQDVPFSFPDTYRHLDKAFPGSKFILTIRDSPEQWYKSLVNFHSRLFGGGQIPTAEQLKNASYVWKGWMWLSNRINYNTPEDDIYNKDILIQHYKDHNNRVLEYFKDRPNDLLVLNLAEKGAYQKFLNFIGMSHSPHDDFPWINKTSELTCK